MVKALKTVQLDGGGGKAFDLAPLFWLHRPAVQADLHAFAFTIVFQLVTIPA
jgi:hypothetical protein